MHEALFGRYSRCRYLLPPTSKLNKARNADSNAGAIDTLLCMMLWINPTSLFTGSLVAALHTRAGRIQLETRNSLLWAGLRRNLVFLVMFGFSE